MASRSVNFSDEDREIVQKLNNLLDQLHVPSRVNTIAEVGAGVFVTLYEGLCGEQLPGIIKTATTREDEIHNVQVVIDSLANDVLHTSLSHINGPDIVDGSREAISNLNEIFSGLLEYMLNKIESDTDNEGDDRQADLTWDDPDLMTPDVIDRILESELRRERLVQEATGKGSQLPSAIWIETADDIEDNETRKLTERNGKATGNGGQSPSKGDHMGDSTLQLIQESERVEKQLQRQATQPTSTYTASSNARQTYGETGRFSAVKEDDKGPSSLIREPSKREDIIKRLERDPRYRNVLPEPSPARVSDREDHEDEDEEDQEDFESLQNMVEETAAMARAAVNASPAGARSLLETLNKVQIQRRNIANGGYKSKSPGTKPLSSRPRPVSTSEVSRSRKDKKEKGVAPSTKRPSPSGRRPSPGRSRYTREQLSDPELTPSQAKRKVSFLTERSIGTSPDDRQDKHKIRQAWDEIGRGHSPPRAHTRTTSATYRYDRGAGRYFSSDDRHGDKENRSYEERLKKQYSDIVDDVLSEEESSGKKKTTRMNQDPALFSVNDTQRLMEKERKSGKKKIGFLQKIYKEDLDELLDEAHYEMDRNRKTAKDTEAEFKKKVLTGIQPSAATRKAASETKQTPSVLKKKKSKPKTYVSSKVSRRSATSKGYLTPTQAKPLEIQGEADILPLLLDEFPHLHLSIHTWHELWNKGLQQIEQVTRSHQEGRRKKSRAQDQLEEAEKRQEIMVNIMKKELEHGHRLKDVKDRQALAISTKNKLHERRMQSARSRHYYDEYQVRMRSKMLKRRTREETVFKKLFEDGLSIQKDRIHELRKYAREQRDGQVTQQRNEIESMENYYRDQFQMLVETISEEKKDLKVREKAQQKVLHTMKKELRKKMETEIKQLQDQLVRDDDDAYFRQIDADRVVHDLQMAKYKVRL